MNILALFLMAFCFLSAESVPIVADSRNKGNCQGLARTPKSETESFLGGMSGLPTVCHDINRNRKTVVYSMSIMSGTALFCFFQSQGFTMYVYNYVCILYIYKHVYKSCTFSVLDLHYNTNIFLHFF